MEKGEVLPIVENPAMPSYEDVSVLVTKKLSRKLAKIKRKGGELCEYRVRDDYDSGLYDMLQVLGLAMLNPNDPESVMEFVRFEPSASKILEQEKELETLRLVNAYNALPKRFGSIVVAHEDSGFIVNSSLAPEILAAIPEQASHPVAAEWHGSIEHSSHDAEVVMSAKGLGRIVEKISVGKKLDSIAENLEKVKDIATSSSRGAVRVDVGYRQITGNVIYHNSSQVIRQALRNSLSADQLWEDELKEQVGFLVDLSAARDSLDRDYQLARDRAELTGVSEAESRQTMRADALKLEEMMRHTLFIIKSKADNRENHARLEAFRNKFDRLLADCTEISDDDLDSPQRKLLAYFRHSVADMLCNVEILKSGDDVVLRSAVEYVGKAGGVVKSVEHMKAVYQGFTEKFSGSLSAPTWDEFYESYQASPDSLEI